MKYKTMVMIGCVAVAMVLMSNLGIFAQQNVPTDPLQRVGMVSVMTVIQQCQLNAAHIKALTDEQEKIIREQTKADQDLKAEAQILQTLIKGTDDFNTQLQLVISKQAALQGQSEYYKQYFVAKDMKWKNELYKDILAAVTKVADAQGLTMVFERTEPRFPIQAEGFAVTVSTHKLIYGKGCVDITGDVIAEIDQ
jgi:Skp family chaperone for outer membrane proteins